MEKSYYEIFKINRNADQIEINDAYITALDDIVEKEYRELIRHYKVPNYKKIVLLSEIFIILSDPFEKRKYDCKLDEKEFDGIPYTFDLMNFNFDYSILEYDKIIKIVNNIIESLSKWNISAVNRGIITDEKQEQEVIDSLNKVISSLSRIKEEKQKPKKKLLTGDKE